MPLNLGPDVSYVYDAEGYATDMVVFQKGKPPLDSELNVVQQIQRLIDQKQLSFLSSGWISFKEFYTSKSLLNSFYTQNPTGAVPEYALVNGQVIWVTNTGTSQDNVNLIELGSPPGSGNEVRGVFLEVWKALLDPDTNTNKPDPASVIDDLNDVYMFDQNNGWSVGENGLILNTENGGQTWNVQGIDTKRNLYSTFFITSKIGWAVGDSGFMARTSSGGASWIPLPVVTTENLRSVHTFNQLIGWACGDAGTILKTTNGVTWLPVTSGTTANFKKIHFIDSLVGWAVGSSGTIIKTTNGGSSWIPQTSGTTQTLNSVYFYNLNYGFAVGDNGTILRTSDGGSSWVSQSNNIYTGSEYTSISNDLMDVTMFPQLDVLVTDEEVSSQMIGSNKSFNVANIPVTLGDGSGTITNDPSKVSVTVNGVPVAVDTLAGATGLVTLANAPAASDTVKVSYWYQGQCAVFQGRAWIVGKAGKVLFTQNIGAQWIEQNPNTSFDLNSIDFTDQNRGWLVGNSAIIRNTVDAGTIWSIQESDVSAREVQRIYNEGNVETTIFLDDNSIHPDANVETTKRVQLQYRVRVVDNVDPSNYPEAGLGSPNIYGLGPNLEGRFTYENMGPVTGDYGLWKAQCSNTVDGFCFAIPMFFVNRRNSAAYNPATNTNGSNVKNSAFIRPDLLVGTNIVDQDILDVRRRSVAPPAIELLSKNFSLLSNNELRTRFFRQTFGGDQYGTEVMQLDRVGGTTSNGGQLITGATLADVIAGDISSEVSLVPSVTDVPATATVPTENTIGPVTGLFHQNSIYYSVVYVSPGSPNNGKPVPGYFEGIGTNTITFKYGSATKTTNDDPTLTDYRISAVWVNSSTVSLKYIPTAPQLVKNFSGVGNPAFFYRGVLDSEDSHVVETWASEIPGYTNSAIAYPGLDYTDTNQRLKASTIEIHQFLTVTADNTDGSNKLILEKFVFPDPDDVPYSIYTVSRINNVLGGFSYKFSDISITDKIRVESISGFPFLEGAIIEVIAYAISEIGDSNVRNGATVNFTPNIKKIGTFCKSYIEEGTFLSNPLVISLQNNAILLGTSVTETATSVQQTFVWVGPELNEAVISGYGTNTLSIQVSGAPLIGSQVTVQVLVQETALTYPSEGAGDGILAAYYFAPHQSVGTLPNSLSLGIVIPPQEIYISNLGTGGIVEGMPFDNPLEHIPVNDTTITSESQFYNIDRLRFPSFSVDSGFVKMPIYIPGNFGEEIIVSSPTDDALDRVYFSQCAKNCQLVTQSLEIASPRKVYAVSLVKVTNESAGIFVKGEYLLLIVSKNLTTEKENTTGFSIGSNNMVAVYRLPNKPLVRT